MFARVATVAIMLAPSLGTFAPQAATAQDPPAAEDSPVAQDASEPTEDASEPTEDASEPTEDGQFAEVRQTILERVNQFRQSEDRSPVKVDQTLQQTAAKFAEYMARTGKYGHRADGRSPAERATAEGYEYCIVLENIAYRTGRLGAIELGEHFFEGWRDSPEHRRNMLNPNVTQMGVGLAKTSDDETVFAVQMFGRPESEQLKISITNRSDAEVKLAVESESSSEVFQVPPRATLTLTRCGSTELRLPEADVARKVSESATLVIRGEGDDLQLEPEEAE